MTSTLNRYLKNKDFKEKFDKEYEEFSLKETLLYLMEEHNFSVRQLAKLTNISPSIIQDIRSGNRLDMKFSNVRKIAWAMGYKIQLKKGKTSIDI